MKINEAVEKALKEKKPITRTSLKGFGFKIFPTDSGDCCYIVYKDEKQQPARCWNPTANDLLADDWEVTDEDTTKTTLPSLKKMQEKMEYLMKKQKEIETIQSSRNTRFAREQFMRAQDEWYWKRTNNLINNNNEQIDEKIKESEKNSFVKAAALTAISTATIFAISFLSNKYHER